MRRMPRKASEKQTSKDFLEEPQKYTKSAADASTCSCGTEGILRIVTRLVEVDTSTQL